MAGSSVKDKEINHLKNPIQTQINETKTLKGVSILKVHDKTTNEDTLTNEIELKKMLVFSSTVKETITSVTKDPTMFEDPSIKETICPIDISIIPKHAKILCFYIHNHMHNEI